MAHEDDVRQLLADDHLNQILYECVDGDRGAEKVSLVTHSSEAGHVNDMPACAESIGNTIPAPATVPRPVCEYECLQITRLRMFLFGRALACTIAGFEGDAGLHVMMDMFREPLEFEVPVDRQRTWHLVVDNVGRRVLQRSGEKHRHTGRHGFLIHITATSSGGDRSRASRP